MNLIDYMGYLSLCFLALFTLSSCGYRLGQDGAIVERYATVCVPYVAQDPDGIFTQILIRQLTTRGALRYCSSGGSLLLQVELLAIQDKNIGYAYAPADQGDRYFSQIVVADEARVSMKARVTLIDRRTQEIVLGPLVVSSFLDYDFEPDLSNINAHAFALGQLEMHNLAIEAACPSLYTLLATKIVDLINHTW